MLTNNTRLRIINSMLRTTGTAPLTAEDTQHPDYIFANDVLSEIVDELASKPLWFNTSRVVLHPDNEGQIIVPGDTIAIDPVGTINLVQRGRYLYDINNSTSVLGYSVECFIQRKVSLEDMPPEALKYIRALARFTYYVDEDGGAAKVRTYEGMVSSAYYDLMVTNISRMDINYFSSVAAQQFFTARPSDYQHIGNGFASTQIENNKNGNFRR